VFSIGTAGCNMHCRNCQNWQLSQRGGEEMETVHRAMPDEVVALARQEGCSAIAYTYNDPIVFYEYVEDTAAAARSAGMRNVFVTAAFINASHCGACAGSWTRPPRTSRPSTTASTRRSAARASSRCSTPW